MILKLQFLKAPYQRIASVWDSDVDLLLRFETVGSSSLGILLPFGSLPLHNRSLYQA